MAKPETTAEYLAGLTPEQRAGLEKIRKAIVSAVPKVAPSFSYRMPAFTLEGRPLIWYAAWKHHFSLYPLSDAMREAHAGEVEGLGTEKGTIRFPAKDPLPLDLIKRLVKTRAAEVRTRNG
ncbi:MAG TPA: DUF1801 domain-containing protein [Gemmatimonadaceae bacterium]|nr:DUF1801 domain-containing protein [Gemmatimonadaceae bacterium]